MAQKAGQMREARPVENTGAGEKPKTETSPDPDGRTRNRLELYEGTVPLFHKYGIEKEIELMYSRHVPLPSAGSLVIDSTAAIVAGFRKRLPAFGQRPWDP